MGFSAWGAGRRIENHQRVRRTFFGELKKRFGNNLEEIHDPFKQKNPTSSKYEEIEHLKNRTRDRRRIFRNIRNVISLLFIALVLLLIYFSLTNSG